VLDDLPLEESKDKLVIRRPGFNTACQAVQSEASPPTLHQERKLLKNCQPFCLIRNVAYTVVLSSVILGQATNFALATKAA